MSKSPAQQVKVHLTTQITQDGEVNNFSVDETGQLVKIGDRLYLRYQESEDNNTIVTIKIFNDNHLTIKRKVGDDIATSMEFSEANDQEFEYPTRFGQILMVSKTKRMKIAIAREPYSGEIELDYSLHSGNNLLGDYKLRLIFN